jgi:hypothetical protein
MATIRELTNRRKEESAKKAAEKAAEKEAELEAALTKYDRPCLSYFLS